MLGSGTVRYDQVLGPLREAYDARAAWRDGLSKQPWKLAERQAFRERLTPGTRLLEIGAGTGQDSAYFQDGGFAVVTTCLPSWRRSGRSCAPLPVPVADAAPSGSESMITSP